MRRLICVSREPEGLRALVLPEEASATHPVLLPLEQLTASEAAACAELRASWEHLGRARGATAETLAHVLRVLLGSVPGAPGPAPARVQLTPPPAPHRRTAAHPRGYRGTIHQPPKRARPEVLDLRPHVLHRAAARALLDSLRPETAGALARLEAEGLCAERLTWVREALQSSSRPEVGLVWRHGLLEVRDAELPASLLWLGCLLEPGAPRDFHRLLALRGRLALDSHPAVRMAALRVLARWGPERGLGWLETAASLPPEAQRALLEALLHPDVPPVDASRYDPRFESLADHAPGWRVEYLRGLAAGLSNDYLLGGFQVLVAHGLRDILLGWTVPTSSGPVPEAALLALFDHVRPRMDGRIFLAWMWALCGQLPGFAALIESTPWRALSVEGAERLVLELTEPWSDTSDEERLRWWRAVRPLHPRLLRLLERVAASHHQRAVHMVFHMLGSWGAKWRGPDWLEPTVFALAERLCRPPFSPLDRLAYVLEPLVAHPEPEVRARLLRLPERSLLRLEAFCSRGDLAGLIGEAMPSLVQRHGTWVLEALETCPDTLARTVQLLGSLRPRARTEVLEDFGREPWVREDPLQLPPPRLAAWLRERCEDGVDSPLPRKARLAWEAGGALTPGQTERALRRVAEGLPRLRFQLLARRVLTRLRGHLEADVDEPRVRHALRMMSLVENNRRGLRRLLTRYFAGERDFALHHPESRAWFARHPRVPEATWRQGLVRRHEVPGWGELTLAVEQDALEVLRMGTYVGSCFGLQGQSAHSAAAFALDVNKRVLYARDARGSVVARQALALSEDDTLVPFAVYPASTPPALAALFLDYDLAFAEALGLPLHDGPEDARVGPVLSQSFWDDGAWDLGAPPASGDE
jgi:hypothetical protein